MVSSWLQCLARLPLKFGLVSDQRDVEEEGCCRPSAGGARCWTSLLYSRLLHTIFQVDLTILFLKI